MVVWCALLAKERLLCVLVRELILSEVSFAADVRRGSVPSLFSSNHSEVLCHGSCMGTIVHEG